MLCSAVVRVSALVDTYDLFTHILHGYFTGRSGDTVDNLGLFQCKNDYYVNSYTEQTVSIYWDGAEFLQCFL